MDARSEATLKGVHPDLAKVIRQASLTSKQPFVVICGLRTEAAEAHNCEAGASETMHSRHLPDKQGLACAVDVMAIYSAQSGRGAGLADWAAQDYQPIAAAVLLASHDLKVPVEWGGDWKTLKDWGHFQLPWAVYP